MLKVLKKNKGITLIALVITIVILLILAGVSIGLLLGENGIITRSREAKERTIIEQKKEEVQQAIAEVLVENERG